MGALNGADPMRVLILGGTSFVGRAIAGAAIARGFDVTLFNRGRSAPPGRCRN
jgi:nucleoside-diphosphate-sugar epimerase